MALSLSLSLALLLPTTYSIVAVDQGDGTVGAAGASCVRSNVIRILGVARGRGVVHAQSYMNPTGRDEAVRRLALFEDPEAILAFITGPGFDPDAARRQYGLADREGRAAAFTGSDCGPHASHQVGRDPRYVWAVQGNLLTGSPVLERTAAAFERGACDLPERLLQAMEAGAENGEGDARCTPEGLPADSAFLAVISPLGAEHDLVLTADEAVEESPLLSLRRQLEAWRAEHPCPSEAADAGALERDAAAPGSALDGGSQADSGSDARNEPREGCTCRCAIGAAPGHGSWLLVGLFALARTLRGSKRSAGAARSGW